ncbi:MAG: hypothetical protein AAGB29_12195 [Planctomycetota bacterium]
MQGSLTALRGSGRALRAVWRWLPECRPIMAEELADSPDGVHRLMVNGRWIVVDRRRKA